MSTLVVFWAALHKRQACICLVHGYQGIFQTLEHKGRASLDKAPAAVTAAEGRRCAALAAAAARSAVALVHDRVTGRRP